AGLDLGENRGLLGASQVAPQEAPAQVSDGQAAGGVDQPVVVGEADARTGGEQPIAVDAGSERKCKPDRRDWIRATVDHRAAQTHGLRINFEAGNKGPRLPIVAELDAASEAGRLEVLDACGVDGRKVNGNWKI